MKHFFFAGLRVGQGLLWAQALLVGLLLALPLSGWASGPSVAEALNPDGTLRGGAQGGFDARGYRVQTGPDGQLRLQRTTATAAADWRTGFNMAGANGPIYTVFRHGADVYVGGYFTAIDDTPARNVARWDGTAWHALGAGLPSTISSLVVDSNGNLYAGANTNSGVTQQDIPFARWDGMTWQALTKGLVIVGVSALTADDQGNVYVGGRAASRFL
jgi:hypothetical protein